MSTKKIGDSGSALLADERIRRAVSDGHGTLYSAVDVAAALADTENSEELWNELKAREPALAELVQTAHFDGVRQEDALSLDGLFRVIQAFPSARAERLRHWLAQTARHPMSSAA